MLAVAEGTFAAYFHASRQCTELRGRARPECRATAPFGQRCSAQKWRVAPVRVRAARSDYTPAGISGDSACSNYHVTFGGCRLPLDGLLRSASCHRFLSMPTGQAQFQRGAERFQCQRLRGRSRCRAADNAARHGAPSAEQQGLPAKRRNRFNWFPVRLPQPWGITLRQMFAQAVVSGEWWQIGVRRRSALVDAWIDAGRAQQRAGKKLMPVQLASVVCCNPVRGGAAPAMKTPAMVLRCPVEPPPFCRRSGTRLWRVSTAPAVVCRQLNISSAQCFQFFR